MGHTQRDKPTLTFVLKMTMLQSYPCYSGASVHRLLGKGEQYVRHLQPFSYLLLGHILVLCAKSPIGWVFMQIVETSARLLDCLQNHVVGQDVASVSKPSRIPAWQI
jgi:hypothetical protein